MTLALTIAGISLLIILHELGHYLVARAAGMKVLRFSVGFGPTLFSFKRGETTWQLAAVPLGGYVQIFGMSPGETESDGRSFRDKPVWARLLVIFAGPLANWLIAAVCIAMLAVSVGFTQYDETKPILGELLAEGAATRSGLLQGDRVLSVNGKQVTDWPSLVAEVRPAPEQTLSFEIERQGQAMKLEVRPDKSEDGGHGVIGAWPHSELQRMGFFPGIAAGFTGAWSLTEKQAGLIWGMLTGTREGRLAGLPGIVKMVSEQAKKGLGRLLESLAVLSIGLFLLNLLPVPALDGSRLVFLVIEAVRGRPINQVIEGWVHAVGFVLLFGLMIFVSVRDLL